MNIGPIVLEVERCLKSFKYKPNSKLKWWWHDDILRLGLTVKVPDSRNPENLIDVTHSRQICRERLDSMVMAFEYYLWEWILRIEQHEAGEWFELYGKKNYFPADEH